MLKTLNFNWLILVYKISLLLLNQLKMSSFTNEINNRLKKYEPLAIISGTTLTIGGLYLFYKVAKDPQGLFINHIDFI